MITPAETVRVLHVDDEPGFAEMTAEFLERQDERFVVETATTAAGGLERLAEDVDCVVSDYEMPEQNGIELLEAVREDHPDLPFVLYTGKGSEEIASDAISAGVTDYLQKGSGTSQYTVLANRIGNAVEQYQSKREVEASRKRLSLFFDQSPLGVVEWDEDLECRRLNETAEEILGYTEAELRGKSWEPLVPESDREAVATGMRELMNEEGGYHIVNENVRKDGEVITCEWHNRAVRDETGDTVAIYSQFRDITDRKEREAELRRKERRYQAVFNDPNILVGLIDTDGTVLDINQTAMEYIDVTLEDVRGERFWRTPWFEHSAAARGEVKDWIDRAASGEYVEFEADRVSAEGEPYTVEGVFRPVTDDAGEIVSLLISSRDVTEQKERERRLKRQTEELEKLTSELEEQYRTLFEEAPIMAVVTRAEEGRPIVEDCNEQFAETLGYGKATVIGSELATFYAPESKTELLDRGGYRRSLKGEFTRERRELVTADGRRVEALLRAVPRYNADGTVVGTMAMFVDITEREAVRRANERLEEFTGIVSHDLRNPLNVAEGELELAQKTDGGEHLAAVERAHDRMDALIDDLLTLAREGEAVTEVEPVDLTTMIESCWANVETAEATLVAGTDRTVRADRSRLKQLFENLIRNAVEHGGESVTVTVGDLPYGFYIEDDGAGIPEADRDEIFEAGHTTSESGTGFGLSIVEEIAEAHDWEIRITTGSEGGARFEITGVEIVDG